MNNFLFRKIKQVGSILVMISLAAITGCNNEDPAKQDVPEFISSVKLIFTPVGGGTTISATATDPDGLGSGSITIDHPINLVKNASYTLTFEILNNLAAPTDPEYNIGNEIEEEADEHQFFFAWTNNVFSNPTGNGNIDNRSDPLNYNDEDANGLPIGLVTSWTATDVASAGTFKVLLKHQPNLKSNTTSSTDGETDIDLTFDITVE
ncbi:MAG: hypothetical protein ABI663_21440 [Chryseolinea sp.]